jgi:cell division protein FtsI/penicillin-binding protein 2
MTPRREKLRGVLILLVLAGSLGGVLARCVYLQIYHCQPSRDRAIRQQLKLIPQSARRGMIVDRCGRELAVSTQVFTIGADPAVMEDRMEAARQLSPVLDMSGDELYRQLSDNTERHFIRLKREASEAEAARVRSLGIRGVVCQPEYRREYPMGELAAHVVGYTDIDGRGLEGVEAGYDKYLSGEAGIWQLRSDAARRPVGVGGKLESSRDGQVVVLSIDAMIQSIVEQQLGEAVKKFHARGAVGIVMDPRTGEVLAMAVNPTFNPANARQASMDRRRNRILTDPVEPGSVFKPFTAAAAIEGGYARIDQKIYCHEGTYSGKGFGTIREYENHAFASLTVAEILVRSSNIGAAILAQTMGKPHFHKMLRAFGFGQKTGIDLPGEGVGILPPLSRWRDKEYTLTRAAFGQSISVTPIQLIRGFCCFANGGKRVQPRVVKGILSSDSSEVVEDFLAKQNQADTAGTSSAVNSDNDRVIGEDVAHALVKEALTAVVSRREGTAHAAYLEGYEIFGKTGTANVPLGNGKRGYAENKFISSFIAGAPAWDPKICVLVMVQEPDRSLRKGYTGGIVAAPVVKEIIEQSLGYLGVERKISESDVVAKKQ